MASALETEETHYDGDGKLQLMRGGGRGGRQQIGDGRSSRLVTGTGREEGEEGEEEEEEEEEWG